MYDINLNHAKKVDENVTFLLDISTTNIEF